MEIIQHPYQDVPQLSSKDQNYIHLEDFLTDYYAFRPDLDTFSDAIQARKNHQINRELLVDSIKEDYGLIATTTQQAENISSLLSQNTFTVITAHQPSLLTGPLYYIYKICSTINLAKKLNERYTDSHVVPVFINGSEDHDFDEIDHLSLFGRPVKWEREASGPVGRLSLEGLADAINETLTMIGENPPHVAKIKSILESSLEDVTIYNQFVFKLVNQLFGKYGLVVINMDKPSLKRNFIPILKKELLERPSESIVSNTQQELTTKGFKAQAFPRDINLFYLGDGSRNRITFADGKYNVIDTDISWTETEILAELDAHPESFSPNVVMRPLYQEYTLPNLAYIGGGGEIAYWLERKAHFAHFEVFFPMLIRRNSAMILTGGDRKQLGKLDLEISQLFQHEDQVISLYLASQTQEDISITDELAEIEKAYHSIAAKAKPFDPGLEKSILAEMTKQLKNVDNLGGRIKRTIKSREEVNVNKIKKLKEKLFPANGLQERKENFLQFYAMYGDDLLDYLVESLDPMDRRFSIINV